MKVGFVGMGKLGLPVALAVESKGHEVFGYDVNPAVYEYMENRTIPFQEEGLQPLLDAHQVKMCQTVGEVVANSEIIFIPVQTPHDPKYEGTTRLPDDRKDFDYTWLKEAVKNVADECREQKLGRTVVTISTCLPGTYEREIKPLLNEYVDYAYSPQFIAMGTVLNDYLDPEFNLIGVESEHAADQLEQFFGTINNAPPIRTDITTAEGIKVSYNTWITAKTVIANLWGEIAEKTGMNFDDIFKAWSVSNKRLLSPRYMQSGMGDGGGCHPRDNIALSHIAEQVGLSHNIFEDLMLAREATEEWHAQVAMLEADTHGLPLTVLGRSFKPETNIETGSPAILMANILEEHEYPFTHVEHAETLPKGVYFLGTKNEVYKTYQFAPGSVVIDPFGYIEEQEGVTVKRLGRVV